MEFTLVCANVMQIYVRDLEAEKKKILDLGYWY